MVKNHRALSDRQRKAVDLYMECGSKVVASEMAGYNRTYAQGLFRQPAVREYLEQRRKQMPAAPAEIMNFLVGVMRGTIPMSELRTKAAIELGCRAGLWKNPKHAMEIVLKEATPNE